jgi:hypothetical protein
MTREEIPSSSPREVVEKLIELMDLTSHLSLEDKQKLYDDPESFINEVRPAESDLGKWQEQVETFLKYYERETIEIEDKPRLSEAQGKRQNELQETILKKLEIFDEIKELAAMKPSKKRSGKTK